MTTRIDRHAALMTRMADTVGVDLEAEMMSGRLTPDQHDELLTACLGCRSADRCAGWMDQSTGAEDTAPSYCANADAFAAKLT